jgi:hypothetical protein
MAVEDAFNKWPEAWPKKKVNMCKSVSAPESLHSDQGGNFESKVFNEMCDLLEIEKTRTTAYHP